MVVVVVVGDIAANVVYGVVRDVGMRGHDG
jgi:hypothetical protein